MICEDILKEGLKKYNIEPVEEIIQRFEVYINLLQEWNKKINLTAITDEKEIIVKHFLDSVSCIQSGVISENSKVIDIGTGAGFPGIPLKIIKPKIELTLLDSLNKRTLFLSELMKNIDLDARIIHGRAEEYGIKPDFREKYDIVLSRAVAPMNILLEYTMPYVKVGGFLLCQKGPGVFNEIDEAKNAVRILGGITEKILSTDVYNSDYNHYIVMVRKVEICPGKYPRKAGNAEKKPIR